MYAQDSVRSKRSKPYVVQLGLVERRVFVCYVVGACNKAHVDTIDYIDSAANNPFLRNVDRLLATQRC